jgi:nitroreductase
VPYWTIDTSMAVMTLLLAAEDVGLGALFFGVFRGERELRQQLAIPPGLELLGAIALGYPAPPSDDSAGGPGRSAGRSRRRPAQIIHRGRW